MASLAEDEMVEQAALLLHERRDARWAEVALEIAFVDGFSQMRTWCRDAYDGDWEPAPGYADLSEEMATLYARLRRLMYRPGTGTWFAARLTVTDQGDYRSDYDFDSEPGFDPPPPREAYVRDLETFPRDPAHLPDWLSARSQGRAPG